MPLGATAMKRRHLLSLGYQVLSLSLDKFYRNSKAEYRSNLLKELMNNKSIDSTFI
jgi:hypothetical protein